LVTRKKVLVVPYYVSPIGEKQVVLVRDSKTKEWGFISGGVKANEEPRQAAERELLEESSSTISFSPQNDHFQFVSLYRPSEMKTIDAQRNEIVRSVYTVFMFRVYKSDVDRIHNQFSPNKEVIDIACGDYNRFEQTWAFCDDVFRNYIRARLANKHTRI
jgi:ADP-ribose pyrophosphatase YjhB (NUDIX family)